MTVKITQEPRQDVVTFLGNVHAEEVSLVDHGANWTPFTTIKSAFGAQGEDAMPGQIIQAILMPVDKNINSLRELYGDDWFNHVQANKCETVNKFNRYVQRPESDFREIERGALFKMIDIPKVGGYFVVGEMHAEAKKQDTDFLLIPESVVWATVATEPVTMEITFGDRFYDVLDNYERVVTGMMGLSQDPKIRIEAHQDAWEAVGEFVTGMLEKLGNKSVKIDHAKGVIGRKRNISGKGNGPGKNVIADASTKQDLAVLSNQIGDLMKQMKAISEIQDTLQHAVVGTPSSPEDDVSVGGTDKGDDDFDSEDPFRGMFKGLWAR